MNKKKNTILGDLFVLEDPQAILERRKAKDARLLSQLTEHERERYLYHLQFQEVLERKAQEHRELFKTMKEKEEKRRKHRAHQAVKEHRLSKRLERIQLRHDNEFIKNVSKSKFYEIIKEEQKLQSLGKLKLQDERELFWSQKLGQKDTSFEPNRLFAGSRMNWDDVLSTKGSEWDDRLPSASPEKATESPAKEPEEEGHHFHTMQKITEEMNEGTSTVVSSRKNTLSQRGRMTMKQLEQLFPKAAMPTLRCFEMDLSERKLVDEEARQFEIRDKKLRQREIEKNAKRTMFELALSNAAITRRILDSHLNDENSDKEDLGLVVDYNAMNDISSLALAEGEKRGSSANSLTKTGKKLQSLTWVKINDANPALRDRLKQFKENSVDLLSNPRFKIHAMKASETESWQQFMTEDGDSSSINQETRSESSAEDRKHVTQHGADSRQHGKVALTQADVESHAVIKYCAKPSTMWRNPFLDFEHGRPASETVEPIE